MSDLDDLDNWEPEPTAADLQSMLRHASPFREDKRAQERRAMCEDAWSRRFECPGCGILKNVTPTFAGDEWHFYAQCSQCGVAWANVRCLLRKCDECGKKVPVTSRNPEGRCKCQGGIPRAFS